MRVEQKEFDGKLRTTIQVARADTRGKIVDIQDACNYSLTSDGSFNINEKVKFNITEYGEGKESVNVQHYMDLDDFNILSSSIQNLSEVNFNDYKGTSSTKYPTGYEARVLTVSWWAEGDRNKGAYAIEIINGAGVRNATGAVSLSKEHAGQSKKVKVILTIAEAMKMFQTGQIYFQAKLTAFLGRNYDKLYPRG